DALSADQLESTHPINVHVKTPGDVDEIFDQISYDKGGSVLHMLEDYVGEKAFQKGLTEYLTTFAYRNATKKDLWTAIQKAHSEKGINAMMECWITQPGYPLIQVAKTKEGFVLTQRRFTLQEKKYTQHWTIPLRYRTAEGTLKSLLFKGKRLELQETTPWIKLNAGQKGLYRVQYDDGLLLELGHSLKAKKFSSLDAAGVENDVFACMVARIYPLSAYFSFVKQWCDDISYPFNSRVSAHLNWLYNFTYKTKARRSVQVLSLAYHGRLVQKLGWIRKSGEKNTDTLMRSVSLASLGIAGDAKVLQKTLLLYRDIERGNVVIDQNMKGVVYSLTAWQGNGETFQRLVERYKKETVPEESRKLLRALGMFRDQNMIKKALDLSQSSTVRLQDSVVIPASTSGN
ncbi:MAG: ERAP1-like C-terminal domain-containing protein, partial [Nanoarchaeota archaeon]